MAKLGVKSKHVNGTEPAISIVTVCYNSAATIGRTFESVLNQDVNDMEYVVIDGASCDNTLEIIEDYRNKFADKDIEMVVVSEPDEGIYDAMNKGIRQCRGKMIGIINSDDYYEPGALALVYSCLGEEPESEIIYGFIRSLDGNKEVCISRYNFEYMYSADNKSGAYNCAGHPTCFVKRSVYEEIGGFDVQFRTAADLDFLMRAALNRNMFHALDSVVTNFSTAGVSNTISDQELAEQKTKILFKNKVIDHDEFSKRSRLLKLRNRKRKIKAFINKLTGR